jgi:hypothetical protein
LIEEFVRLWEGNKHVGRPGSASNNILGAPNGAEADAAQLVATD